MCVYKSTTVVATGVQGRASGIYKNYDKKTFKPYLTKYKIALDPLFMVYFHTKCLNLFLILDIHPQDPQPYNKCFIEPDRS